MNTRIVPSASSSRPFRCLALTAPSAATFALVETHPGAPARIFPRGAHRNRAPADDAAHAMSLLHSLAGLTTKLSVLLEKVHRAAAGHSLGSGHKGDLSREP